MPLCVAAAVQNEAAWLPEWLEYHDAAHWRVRAQCTTTKAPTTRAACWVVERAPGRPCGRFSTALFCAPLRVDHAERDGSMRAPAAAETDRPVNPPYSHWCEYAGILSRGRRARSATRRERRPRALRVVCLCRRGRAVSSTAAQTPLHRWLSSLDGGRRRRDAGAKRRVTEYVRRLADCSKPSSSSSREFVRLAGARVGCGPNGRDPAAPVGSIHAIVLLQRPAIRAPTPLWRSRAFATAADFEARTTSATLSGGRRRATVCAPWRARA